MLTVVVDEIKEVVAQVSSNLTNYLKSKDEYIEGVHYMHGHPLEIAQTLAEKTKAGSYVFKKYPLIALLQDFPEKKTGEIGIESNVNLHFLICKGTDPTYKSSNRYEKNFKPFLYPIYEDFLKEIHNHKRFSTIAEDAIKHTKIDRLFWGTHHEMQNKANIFLDHLDIIEIKDLELIIKTNYC